MKLSHLDKEGKSQMVDVGGKEKTKRKARAACSIAMEKETLDLIMAGKIEKGDVLTTANIAGTMAAKRTADLIPLCHPLSITSIDIFFKRTKDNELTVGSEVKANDATGVEMEALTACSIAALTVYDMVKSVEKGVQITDLRLLEKEGGKSGKWQSDKGGQ